MKQLLLLGIVALMLAGASGHPSDPYGQSTSGQHPAILSSQRTYPGILIRQWALPPQSVLSCASLTRLRALTPSLHRSVAGLRCPIAASSNWQAYVNAMPGPNSGPKLVVTGKVITASPSYHIEFDPKLQVRKSYPVQAFATLIVTPPAAGVPQALYSQEVHWEWPMREPIGAVEIRCGSETLATISPVQSLLIC
jgi:hypothetical protein